MPVSHHFDERAATWDDDPVKTARAAEVARQIMERVRPTASTEVLDFGSGTGLLGFHFFPHVASVAFADTSEGMLRQVETKLRDHPHLRGETLHLDPQALALPRSYDLVVSLMTLHHVADPMATLRLLADRLSPGGWLAVCDLDTEDGSFHDDPEAEVHHGFDRAALTAHLARLGLQDVQTSTPWVMRHERPEVERVYPLFLLTAQRPA